MLETVAFAMQSWLDSQPYRFYVLAPPAVACRWMKNIEQSAHSSSSSLESNAVVSKTTSSDEVQDEFDIFDRPVSQLDTVRKKNVESLSPQAKELLTDIGLQRDFDLLKRAHKDFLRSIE